MATDISFLPPTQKLFSFFDFLDVSYTILTHKEAITSEEAASVRPGYSLKQGVKALIVKKEKGEERFVQIVVPGDKKFDSKKVRMLLGTSSVSLCNEMELAEITGGILPGGVHPFGMLFDIPIYADVSIFENTKIVFSCGDRRVSVVLSTEDYRKILDTHRCFVRNVVR